jgi:hypothetical protein
MQLHRLWLEKFGFGYRKSVGEQNLTVETMWDETAAKFTKV